MASSYGTPQKRDQALAADENAAASILTTEANLDTAKINLGYTDIRSPIAGKISRTKITKGNVVSPDSGVLTTVVSQDPMYVVFPVSQREFLDVRAEGNGVDRSRLEVTIHFSDGSVYAHKGRIDFVDVSVDKSTDTVTVRATLPNPDDTLDRWPARPREHRFWRAAGKDRHPSGRAHRGPAGHLCLRR